MRKYLLMVIALLLIATGIILYYGHTQQWWDVAFIPEYWQGQDILATLIKKISDNSDYAWMALIGALVVIVTARYLCAFFMAKKSTTSAAVQETSLLQAYFTQGPNFLKKQAPANLANVLDTLAKQANSLVAEQTTDAARAYYTNLAVVFNWLMDKTIDAGSATSNTEAKKAVDEMFEYIFEHVGDARDGVIFELWVEDYANARDYFLKFIAKERPDQNVPNFDFLAAQKAIFEQLEKLQIKHIFLSSLLEDITPQSDEKIRNFGYGNSLPDKDTLIEKLGAAKAYAALHLDVTLHKNFTKQELDGFTNWLEQAIENQKEFDLQKLLFQPSCDSMMREVKKFMQTNPGQTVAIVWSKGHYLPFYFGSGFNPRLYSLRVGTEATPKTIQFSESVPVNLSATIKQ